MKRILLFAIRFYQRNISALYPYKRCKYLPTCSEYAYEAIKVHGPVKGLLMAMWRVLRCNPFSKGGYDPVKPQQLTD